MAKIYLRPTSDNYVNFALEPADSPNAYTLIDDAVPDSTSTYIYIKPDTADTRITKSASFTFAGSSFPLKEFAITKININGKAVASTYATECAVSYTVKSNGVMGISDIIPLKATFLTTSGNTSLYDISFDRFGNFLAMLNNYVKENGKLPDIEVIVTMHYTSSKANQSSGITQLYLEIEYNSSVYQKSYTWNPTNAVYKKINGSWQLATDGATQMRGHLHTKGHKITRLAYKAPTCGKTGLTEGYKCSHCNEIHVPQEVIPATGEHTLTDYDAKEPTCGASGNTAYSYCSTCYSSFGYEEIPATGNHTLTDVEGVQPNCITSGFAPGTKCTVCNNYISGHETLPATGIHTPVDADAVEPTCGVVGHTAGTKCSVCGIWLSGQEIPATGNHTIVEVAATAPTCTTFGYTAGTQCSVCSTWLSGHEAIPATGNHTLVTINTVAPTDWDNGFDTVTCSTCNNIINYIVVPSLGHVCTPMTVAGKAPTCVSTGLTDGQRCSVCGKTLVAQQTIPATGVHTYITSGNYQICSVCGYVKELNVTNIVYHHSTTALSLPRDELSATTVGNYALFGGGYYSDDEADVTDGFNTSLTRVGVSRLQHDDANKRNAATTVGNYALFGGGRGEPSSVKSFLTTNSVTAYDTALTRTYPSDLNDHSHKLAATTVGNYALFGGGHNYSQSFGATVDNDWLYNVTAYNTSLSKSTAANLSSEKCGLAATTVGNYALFGGGVRDGVTSNTVDTYNTSLTKGTASTLSVTRDDLAATTVGGYAIFGGGWNGSDVNTVDAYNQNLTKVSIAPLSVARDQLAATTVGDYALFGGGDGTNYVDIYDKNLTKIPAIRLSSARKLLAATTLGNYALFGGGSDSATVDVFTVR